VTNPHPIDVSSERILVTGGSGFLGSHVVRALHGRGCRTVAVARKKQYDLVEITAVRRLYDDVRPEIVVHLAAVVGGIGANRRQPV
jgi:GDP-L-fucose synthase